MAVGTLAIGLTFIAGAFLTGMYLATFSSERTIAAVAAEEAFAKMQIFGLDLNDPNLKTTGFTVYEDLTSLPSDEMLYPSIRQEARTQYSWAVICRQVADSGDLVQCAAFVSRETGRNSSYWKRENGTGAPRLDTYDRPRPVRLNIVRDATGYANDEIALQDAIPGDVVDERTFVSEGSILVDDATGQLYQVLERSVDKPERVRLDRPWEGGAIAPQTGGWVWVVPPATTGGRNPGVAVYEKILKFPKTTITGPNTVN